MNEITTYITGLIITLGISFTFFLTFRPYLKRILLELNGNLEKAANFWVVYSGIILFLVPLVFAMAITPDPDKSLFFQLSKQIRWSLIGVIISFFAFGIAIISFVPKDKKKE